MLVYLIQGAVYGFAAAAQPGPFMAYLVSQTVSNGWRRALPMILAPLLSDGPILIMALFLLSRIPPWWIQLLRFSGGFFLLYLSFGAWRAWRSAAHGESPRQPCSQTLLRAVLVNILNPNPYLYWGLVTGPLLLVGWREAPANGLAFLAGFYGAIVAGSAAILLASAYAGGRSDTWSRRLAGLSGIGLAVFGLYQIALGVVGWR